MWWKRHLRLMTVIAETTKELWKLNECENGKPEMITEEGGTRRAKATKPEEETCESHGNFREGESLTQKAEDMMVSGGRRGELFADQSGTLSVNCDQSLENSNMHHRKLKGNLEI